MHFGMVSFWNKLKGVLGRLANRKQTSKTPAKTQQGSNAQQPVSAASQKTAQPSSSQVVTHSAAATTVSNTLSIQLQNQTSSSTVYAYISKSPCSHIHPSTGVPSMRVRFIRLRHHTMPQ
jgi:hypothetical protein